MSLLIDTNVLLRLAQPSSADHATAREALLKLDAEHVELCLVPQVVYEFWVAATRPVSVNGLGMDLATAEDSVLRMIRRFRFFRDERGIFERWHSLVVGSAVLGKTAHDARLVAAIRRHAITTF